MRDRRVEMKGVVVGGVGWGWWRRPMGVIDLNAGDRKRK